MRFNTSFLERNIFFALLISLVFAFTVAPFLEERGLASQLLNVFLVILLVFSIIIVSDTKGTSINLLRDPNTSLGG